MISFRSIRPRKIFSIGLVFLIPFAAHAGVTNPDISAIGQILSGQTSDATSPDANQPTLKLGEAEIVLDAYLNPYFKGLLTLSGDETGIGLEEAYVTMVKGLPLGLALKAGKYRLGFGKMNAIHPHAYPFIEPPRSSKALLPGEDGFNETAVQGSILLPTMGDWASNFSIDLIEGKQFHEENFSPEIYANGISEKNMSSTRLGYLARWSNDILIGEQNAMESGFSAATGIDNIEQESRAWLLGADLKAKFYLPGSSQLVIQGEGIYQYRHGDSIFTLDTIGIPPGERIPNHAFAGKDRYGFHAFTDYKFHTHYNAGIFYEQWQNASSNPDRAFRIFVGYAVLEESTMLRLSYEHLMPDQLDPVETISMQLLFSMGPHKAHQF